MEVLTAAVRASGLHGPEVKRSWNRTRKKPEDFSVAVDAGTEFYFGSGPTKNMAAMELLVQIVRRQKDEEHNWSDKDPMGDAGLS